MKILEIKAENYRTLENVSIQFHSNYCTISGKNNAGKSCLIRLIISLLGHQDDRDWRNPYPDFDYNDDKTQWIKETPNIDLNYTIVLDKTDDASLITFIEKQTSQKIDADNALLGITTSVDNDSIIREKVYLDDQETDSRSGAEILTKIRNSNTLFLHNSTNISNDYLYRKGKFLAAYGVILSPEERKSVSDAEASLQRRVKKLAKTHRDELSGMLGKLSEKYDVEFSTAEGYSSPRMPLGINLRDKNVEVPLTDWGSGTQNRTRILMSILQANRIKTKGKESDHITPIVVIEEPESFLHPGAQAEFGRILQSLSSDLGIQIIVATHSPYMLNQVEPKSNILLRRKVYRGKQANSEVVEISEDNWMAPFAEHLGVIPPEFDTWRKSFSDINGDVLYVEGEIDKSYLEYIRDKFKSKISIPENLEILPYGGKDALKNSALLKFVLRRSSRYFITYDLDCDGEVAARLESIGLKRNIDFAPVGIRGHREDIEGLLPDRVLSEVTRKETELVRKLMSANTSIRNEARSSLKKKFLEEFKNHDDYTEAELRELTKLGRLISKKFA